MTLNVMQVASYNKGMARFCLVFLISACATLSYLFIIPLPPDKVVFG